MGDRWQHPDEQRMRMERMFPDPDDSTRDVTEHEPERLDHLKGKLKAADTLARVASLVARLLDAV